MPEYSFRSTPTSLSDRKKMKRCWELYKSFDSDNNFDLAAGIHSSTWVSGGSNERRSHAKLYPYRAALHAEQVAMMGARCDIRNATLYVCRLSHSSKKFRLSLPCFWCMHNILKQGISKVVYTKDDGDLVAFKTSTVLIDPIYSVDIDYQEMVLL